MANSVALARAVATHPAAWLRPVIVLACAAALILAERALPLL